MQKSCLQPILGLSVQLFRLLRKFDAKGHIVLYSVYTYDRIPNIAAYKNIISKILLKTRNKLILCFVPGCRLPDQHKIPAEPIDLSLIQFAAALKQPFKFLFISRSEFLFARIIHSKCFLAQIKNQFRVRRSVRLFKAQCCHNTFSACHCNYSFHVL